MQELSELELEQVCGGKSRKAMFPDLNPTIKKVNDAVDAHRDAARNFNRFLEQHSQR